MDQEVTTEEAIIEEDWKLAAVSTEETVAHISQESQQASRWPPTMDTPIGFQEQDLSSIRVAHSSPSAAERADLSRNEASYLPNQFDTGMSESANTLGVLAQALVSRTSSEIYEEAGVILDDHMQDTQTAKSSASTQTLSNQMKKKDGPLKRAVKAAGKGVKQLMSHSPTPKLGSNDSTTHSQGSKERSWGYGHET